jgi:hypothetical protein
MQRSHPKKENQQGREEEREEEERGKNGGREGRGKAQAFSRSEEHQQMPALVGARCLSGHEVSYTHSPLPGRKDKVLMIK